MIKINHGALNRFGLNRANDDEVLHDLCELLGWLESHNKNYTKMQYDKILDALDFVKALEIVEG